MKHGQPLLPIVGELNTRFSQPHLASMVEKSADFAPGKSLPKALANLVTKPGAALHDAFEAYLEEIPGSIQETVRGVVFHALTSSPPKVITWSWQASYDYGLTVWEIVEPAPHLSGITLAIRSRYPDDPHPNAV